MVGERRAQHRAEGRRRRIVIGVLTAVLVAAVIVPAVWAAVEGWWDSVAIWLALGGLGWLAGRGRARGGGSVGYVVYLIACAACVLLSVAAFFVVGDETSDAVIAAGFAIGWTAAFVGVVELRRREALRSEPTLPW